MFIPVLVFGHFTKILRNLYLHAARQDGQDGKKWKENHATKVTKSQKPKIWDEWNNGAKIQTYVLEEELYNKKIYKQQVSFMLGD